jgi:hypothetical protein
LIDTLKHLRDIGNSVLVVEHDEDMIRAADHCLDMGPGAGVHGGRVMAQGTPADIEANPNSLTGRYMSGALQIAVPSNAALLAFATTRHPTSCTQQKRVWGHACRANFKQRQAIPDHFGRTWQQFEARGR